MIKEFREFIMRGNVMDLAVAVIIGSAFGKIVGSLVNDILMPLVGLAMGGVNFSEQAFTVGAAVVKWGMFVQTVIDFLVVAFVIFMVIKAANSMKKTPPPAPRPGVIPPKPQPDPPTATGRTSNHSPGRTKTTEWPSML